MRFVVCRNHPVSGVECFCYIIVYTQCLVQKPLLARRFHFSTDTQTTQRVLWQQKSGTRQRASAKQKNVAPGQLMQTSKSHLNLLGRPLCKETFRLLHRDRFHSYRWISIFLIVHVRSPPAALRVLPSPRSCCAKCHIRQRKPESRAGQGKGCKSIAARNARHAPRYILQRSQPTNEAAWVCESPSQSRPKGSPRLERKSMLC